MTPKPSDLTPEQLAERQRDACLLIHYSGCATYRSLSYVCDCGSITVAPWVREQAQSAPRARS